MSVKISGLIVFSEGDLTIDNSSTRLPVGSILVTPPPIRAELFLEDAQIRFELDGTDPTASAGTILNPFDTLTLTDPAQMYNFRGIRTGSVNGTIHYRFYR